jgi:hypothetical protein
MVIQVTKADSGVAFSINGGPARPLPWVEGLTFRQGGSLLTFKTGPSGQATALHFAGGAAYYVLKRQ